MQPLKRRLQIAMVALAGLVCLSLAGGVYLTPSMRHQAPNLAKASPEAGDVPLCSAAVPASAVKPAGNQSAPSPHKATLSWNASVPTSASPRDAIKGYYVYRSEASNTYANSNRLNATPLQGTSCVDLAVVAQGVYFYVVTAVSQSGESGHSNEIKVTIPPDAVPPK